MVRPGLIGRGLYTSANGIENSKKAIGSVLKNEKERARFVCLFVCLVSLHGYDVKRPNFSFMGYVT